MLGQNPLNMDGRNIGEVLGIGKQYLPLMQEVDINRATLGVMKKLLSREFPLTASFCFGVRKTP